MTTHVSNSNLFFLLAAFCFESTGRFNVITILKSLNQIHENQILVFISIFLSSHFFDLLQFKFNWNSINCQLASMLAFTRIQIKKHLKFFQYFWSSVIAIAFITNLIFNSLTDLILENNSESPCIFWMNLLKTECHHCKLSSSNKKIAITKKTSCKLKFQQIVVNYVDAWHTSSIFTFLFVDVNFAEILIVLWNFNGLLLIDIEISL